MIESNASISTKAVRWPYSARSRVAVVHSRVMPPSGARDWNPIWAKIWPCAPSGHHALARAPSANSLVRSIAAYWLLGALGPRTRRDHRLSCRYDIGRALR